MAFDLTLIGATNATISNGVYTLPLIEPFDNGGITDASGNIVYWIFNCCETVAGSEVALSTWNAPDYLGVQDSAFRHNLDGTVNEANNRDVPGTWSSGPATVPDQGATLTLICLALVTLLGFKYAQGPNDFAS
jgi:hypothetical protein